MIIFRIQRSRSHLDVRQAFNWIELEESCLSSKRFNDEWKSCWIRGQPPSEQFEVSSSSTMPSWHRLQSAAFHQEDADLNYESQSASQDAEMPLLFNCFIVVQNERIKSFIYSNCKLPHYFGQAMIIAHERNSRLWIPECFTRRLASSGC